MRILIRMQGSGILIHESWIQIPDPDRNCHQIAFIPFSGCCRGCAEDPGDEENLLVIIIIACIIILNQRCVKIS